MPTTLTDARDGRVLAWLPKHEIDDEVRAQALRTAGVACVRGHVALMPDAHLGKGATIGSVIPTADAIIPSAVGVDIGCGVVAAPVRDLTLERLPEDLDPLVERWTRAIPAGLGQWTGDIDRAWAAFEQEHGHPTVWDDDPKVAERAPRQLGTLGSGNHFLELCADDADQGEGERQRAGGRGSQGEGERQRAGGRGSQGEGERQRAGGRGSQGEGERQRAGGRGSQVWLMLHSGSRGPGNRLATHHMERAKSVMRRLALDVPDPELAYLVQGEPEFDAYIHDLLWAQAYARFNRDRMMRLALAELAALAGGPLEFDESRYVNNHHNFAALEEHGGRKLWITRKGAISARTGQLGVIPGSMGTGSYIVRGRGDPASYHSASHGAGRRMSRTKARKTFTAEDMARAMQGRVWQRAAARRLIDEIPGAYKDLDAVIAYQHDLVEVVTHLRTLVNYKGT